MRWRDVEYLIFLFVTGRVRCNRFTCPQYFPSRTRVAAVVPRTQGFLGSQINALARFLIPNLCFCYRKGASQSFRTRRVPSFPNSCRWRRSARPKYSPLPTSTRPHRFACLKHSTLTNRCVGDSQVSAVPDLLILRPSVTRRILADGFGEPKLETHLAS